jgi:hypothetical protein
MKEFPASSALCYILMAMEACGSIIHNRGSHSRGSSTGRALLAAVDEIAEKSCVTALRKSPLVLAGICGAGQFAYEFSAYAPNRTGAFFTMGGSMHDLDLAGKAAAVPGLLVAATDHGEDPINNMFALFACGRRYSAPWNFSAEPMGDYDKGHSSPLASIFIGKALERLYAESEDAIDPNIKSNLLLPLREAAFATGNFSNNIAGTMAAIHASSLNCAFLDQETAEAWVGHIGTNRVPDLSFVSVPLPESGTVSPSTLDMGTMSPKSGAGAGFFDVQCRPDASVDQVVIKTIQKGVNCLVKQLGTNDWRVECRLDPIYFPCGGFREDIPIRFLHRGQTIPGGISAFVVGRIVGDIRAEPSAIALGRIAPTGGEARLRLSSASGSDIEVLNIQSSLPEWAKTKILAKGHSWVDIGCRISPPPQLRGKGFSGYYFIRAKSSDLETVKELFYGIITD